MQQQKQKILFVRSKEGRGGVIIYAATYKKNIHTFGHHYKRASIVGASNRTDVETFIPLLHNPFLFFFWGGEKLREVKENELHEVQMGRSYLMKKVWR